MGEICYAYVTLCDGNYKNQISFSLDYIIEIVEHVENLRAARVEYIEIGCQKGSFKPMDNIDQTGLCFDDYTQLLRNAVHDAKLVVIVRIRII
ncbi:hypothetical protein [Bartonella sp. B41]